MQAKAPSVPRDPRVPPRDPRAIACANCGIDIREGVIREGEPYCCEGCWIGGPCIC